MEMIEVRTKFKLPSRKLFRVLISDKHEENLISRALIEKIPSVEED